MSFQYVSSMRLPLRRNQAATVDPSAETLSIDGSSTMYLRDQRTTSSRSTAGRLDAGP